jgi:uncharacterized protein
MENVRGRTVLITGASAGIGKAFAEVFAAKGWNVVLTARRTDRLEALAAELSAKHKVAATPIPEDLAHPDGVKRLVEAISNHRLVIDGLVNNAGYGVPGHYARTRWEDQEAFLRVLVTAPCELAHVLLPPMIQRRFGRIVNVASLAGLVPGSAGHTLYGAAKAFMIKFSQSLLLENRGANVLTTALCPGFTHSEFHDVTGNRARVSRFGKHWWSSAEDVAEAGYEGVMAGRAIVVAGRRAKQVAALMKVLPDSLALGIVNSQSKTYRKK